MKKVVKNDLADIVDAMESLIKQLPDLQKAEKVDVLARVRSIKKSVESIDKAIGDDIKAWRKNKAGVVLGEQFKADLAYNPVKRLDQSGLKAGDPDTWEKWAKTNNEARITLSPR